MISQKVDLGNGQVTLHYVERPHDLTLVSTWLAARATEMLGLDSETNALSPWHPGFRVRTVQLADRDEAWVINVETIGATNVAPLIHGHQFWVAQYPGIAEVPFLANGLPGSLRLTDDDRPHVLDLQVTLSWYDVRTNAMGQGADKIDPRIPHKRGLKDTTTRELTPVLAEVEHEMHEWFRLNAPKGQRTPKASIAWGFANVPLDSDIFVRYAGLDPLCTVRLWELFVARLTERGVMASVVEDLRDQWDCDRAVLRGLPVDGPYARWLSDQLHAVITEATDRLGDYGVRPTGMGPQVGQAFTKLGVSSPKTSPKTGAPSWDKEALKALSSRDDEAGELARTIIDVRKATKFHSAYVQPMLDALELDGRVHCNLRVLGTVTGRMSASNPAIQQLPKKDTRVRAAFGTQPGWVFVSCDLAQGEPRTMAALSGDPNLIRDIAVGDINNAVTAVAFGEAFDPAQGKIAGTPSYLMRQGGKAGFLAKVYGAGVGRLTSTLGVPEPTARAIDANWDTEYRVLFNRGSRLNHGISVTLANGWVAPLWDRFTVDDDGGLVVYSKPSRKALNAEIQGTQKLYLMRAWRKLRMRGYADFLAMFVHDEIVLLVPDFMAKQARLDLEECMTFDLDYGVRMECEATIDGPTWLPQPSDFDLRELETIEL